MAKKATINGCIGCGVCASICPEIFELNDDHLAENILGEDAELPEDLENDVYTAATSCPVNAITVE